MLINFLTAISAAQSFVVLAQRSTDERRTMLWTMTPPPACGKTASGGSECKHGKIIYSNDAADISWAKERIRWVLSQQGVEGGTLLAAPTVNSLAAAAAAAATRLHSKTVNRRGFKFVTASLVRGGHQSPTQNRRHPLIWQRRRRPWWKDSIN